MVIAGLCAVSMSWGGAVTGHVLPAYPLDSLEETRFLRDGKMSKFWTDWENYPTLDYLFMTPASNGWVNGADSFSGLDDAELNIRAAYGVSGLYLMFDIHDNIWISGQGYGMDNLNILLDTISSQEMRDANPYELYAPSSWNWTITYYSVQYTMNVGSVNAVLPQTININYFSGSAMSYNLVNLNRLPTEYAGWDLDIASIDSNTRQVEWKIPWTWVGCGGGIGHMPPTGMMIAMSGGYNDADTPDQIGRKSLVWKERDPFTNCLDMVPSHAFCDAWGDILISSGCPKFFTIVSPRTGDRWTSGTPITIQWTTNVPIISDVTISYTLDGWKTWNTIISTPNTGSFIWTLPPVPYFQKAIICISDASDNSHTATTPTFTITPSTNVITKAPPMVPATNSICHDRISGTVTMNINLASAGTISAVIYGPDGKLIRQINAGSASPGYHSIRWDGRNAHGQLVHNGCYQVKIRAGNATFIKPLIMAR